MIRYDMIRRHPCGDLNLDLEEVKRTYCELTCRFEEPLRKEGRKEGRLDLYE